MDASDARRGGAGPVLAVLAAATLFGTTGTAQALGPSGTTPLGVGAARIVVGGLIGKRLGRVPIPGARITVDGWDLTAESLAGRRNRIGTVLAEPVVPRADADAEEADVHG